MVAEELQQFKTANKWLLKKGHKLYQNMKSKSLIKRHDEN